ncbi:ankyrin repeat domain-containing protein [Ramlibacter sp. AW1]|uniref:Ankyrin repeat domain-containing protein n=1 Tax=Ramlibacter aurantiacus TaxID=2801330 RepID=A0A937D1H6_9BURK|nr:ankyrin repeat domain-containing protein [Ramlibacter aurantiacus]MBL0418790.1 ankyrin repeat domain-containing protein [Ramlibacter aurantiacus]
MKNSIRWLAWLLILAACSLAKAGSYEDWFAAIKRDDAAAVQRLLAAGFDANTVSPDGQHGLYLALREPSLKVAQVLVRWPQTKVESRNAADESPLMMAALKGHTELVRRLIERDADVNKPGWAPLHYAATNGHLDIMALLLEHHAFIDAQSPNGTTPLMMAAMYGTPQAVKLLLEEGADVHMKNQLGMTAMDFAQKARRPDAADLITQRLRQLQQPTRRQAPAAQPARQSPPRPAASW